MNTVNSEFERQKRRKRAVKKGVMVLKYAALAVASFIVLMPILWFMTSSFRSNNEVFANINPFSLREMFFGTYSLENYRTIFVKYNFARTVGNTLLVCFLTITIGICVCSMAGYALAKMEFKGKRIMMMLVLFSIMIPFDAIAIPLYSIIMKLRWIDTYKAVILPAVANGMTIFLFRQSFVDIDNSLLESARMDGATGIKTFFYITLPMIRNVSMVVVTLMFIWGFNNFDIIYLLTQGGPLEATFTLPIYTYNTAFYRGQMGYASAISMMTLVILLFFCAVYMKMQKGKDDV